MNLREAVQQYSSKGWNVIPLARGSKEPLAGFPLEPYFKVKYPVESFNALPDDLNLGIVLGETSNLSVIDLDDPSKLNSYLNSFPTDLIQRTPTRGGYHLFYDYDPSFPEIKKVPDGDFFSGKHYIVVAPSKVSAGSYEWIKSGSPGKFSKSQLEETKLFEITAGKYSRAQVLEILNYAMREGKFPDGQRNDGIIYCAMILAGDGWSKEAVFNLLNPIQQKGEHPDNAKRVLGMIDRAFEYASKNVKPEQPVNTTGKTFNGVNKTLSISSYGQISALYENYKAEWLVDGWILDSAIMICSAPPETYKTWLSVDLAISVASGMPFLDTFEIKHPGNVLIVQQEDFGARFFSRFSAIESSKTIRSGEEVVLEETETGIKYFSPYDLSNKIFFHTEAQLTLDNDEIINILEQRIKETSARLCIIDPFYSLGDTDNYYANIANQIREKIKAIRNRTGCAFWFVHHTRKNTNNSNGDDRNEIYGSQFVNAVMEGAVSMLRPDKAERNRVLVSRKFKDESAQLPVELVFHINLNKGEDQAYVLEVQELSEGLLELVKEFLRDNGASSASDIFREFSDKFSSRSTFFRWIGEQSGISKGKNGKYSVAADDNSN